MSTSWENEQIKRFVSQNELQYQSFPQHEPQRDSKRKILDDRTSHRRQIPRSSVTMSLPLSYDPKNGTMRLEKRAFISSSSHVFLGGPWTSNLAVMSRSLGKSGFYSAKGSIRHGSKYGQYEMGLSLGRQVPTASVVARLEPTKKASVMCTVERIPLKLTHISDDVLHEATAFSVSYRQLINTVVAVQSTLKGTPLTPRIDVGVMSASTKHSWGLCVGVSSRVMTPSLSVHVEPKLRQNCRLRLQASLLDNQNGRISAWSVRAAMLQSLAKARQLEISLAQHSTGLTRGLVWTLGWHESGFQIRVPLDLTGITTSTPWYPLYCVCFSLLSTAIHGVVTRVFASSQDLDKQHRLERIHVNGKSRMEAIQQQELMRSQANRRQRAEESCDGLVILKAIFYVDGGDVLDVTIPLQFWVSQSELKMTVKGGESLGFYNVANTARKTPPKKEFTTSWHGWLAGFWRLDTKLNSQPPATATFIQVKYRYQKLTQERLFCEDDTLCLP